MYDIGENSVVSVEEEDDDEDERQRDSQLSESANLEVETAGGISYAGQETWGHRRTKDKRVTHHASRIANTLAWDTHNPSCHHHDDDGGIRSTDTIGCQRPRFGRKQICGLEGVDVRNGPNDER